MYVLFVSTRGGNALHDFFLNKVQYFVFCRYCMADHEINEFFSRYKISIFTVF